MRTVIATAVALMFLFPAGGRAAEKTTSQRQIMMVIHGGAGTIRKADMTPEQEKEYVAVLEQALRAGHKVLSGGGKSLDAVEAAVRVMEDSPLFNAGRGAVFTHEGRNEMDASIMDGATKKAGAVAGVSIIRNPIVAARAVMDKSPHVLLSGRGAELFASGVGVETVDPSYFWTKKRWDQLQDALEKEKAAAAKGVARWRDPSSLSTDEKFGTVGALALDRQGDLAAATSTGGTTNKRPGRIGDSPIPGAGTWADNDSCAVSGTGTGEYFIRLAVAHEVSALMKYKGMSVGDAAHHVIMDELKAVGGPGSGGLIALDRNGNFAMPFNTEGMYRGWMGADGVPHVAIYGE